MVNSKNKADESLLLEILVVLNDFISILSVCKLYSSICCPFTGEKILIKTNILKDNPLFLKLFQGLNSIQRKIKNILFS